MPNQTKETKPQQTSLPEEVHIQLARQAYKASIPSSPISFIYHFSTPNMPKASHTALNHLLYYFNYTHCSNSSDLSTKEF